MEENELVLLKLNLSELMITRQTLIQKHSKDKHL